MVLERRHRLVASKRIPRRLLTFTAVPALLLLVASRHYFVSSNLPSNLFLSSGGSSPKVIQRGLSNYPGYVPEFDVEEVVNRPIKVAVLTAYPPEWHGIGEWVNDHINRGLKRLCKKLELATESNKTCPLEFGIFAQDSGDVLRSYPAEVRFVIRRGVLEDYFRAATHINAHYDVLTIQHEFGMFGGPYIDDFLFAFWDKIRIPVNVNFHTVLGWGSQVPNIEFRLHVREVLRRADHVTHFMPQLCKYHHSLEPDLPCTHVPHGYEAQLPETTHVDKAYRHLLEGRRIILSLGFITPDKGFHFMIRGMPEVVKAAPSALYLIVGGYAPGYGGDYLGAMQEEVKQLNLTNHVMFLTTGNLQKWEVLEWFSLAEVVVAPHTWRHQISSGTITMGMGYGKAVVASSFPYAQAYMCDPDVPPMEPEVFQRGVPNQKAPPVPEFEPRNPDQPQPCWTVPYMANGAPRAAELGRTVSALLARPELLQGTQRLSLEKVKGTTFEELTHRYISIYRHMVRAARRSEASSIRRADMAMAEAATSASWRWSDTDSQRQVAAAAASLMPSTDAMKESPRQRRRRRRQWSQGLTLEHLVEVLRRGGGKAAGVAGQVSPSQAADLIMGPFSRGPLLFSRWVGRPPRGKALRLVETTREGHFAVDNGLLTLHGDLSIGKVMHSVPQGGFVFGHGVYYQAALAFTLKGQRYHADVDVPQGVQWGSSESGVWCEVDLKGEAGRLVGTYRVTYTATAGSPVLTARYDIYPKAGVRFDVAEVSSKIHYGEKVPQHDSFHAFCGLGKTERCFALAPVVTANDVIYNRQREGRAFDWDVLTDRNGDHAVLTYSPDMAKLRWVSYENAKDSSAFLHVAHRYMLSGLQGGTTHSITESRIILSQAEPSLLEHYGNLFESSPQTLGFDPSYPKNKTGVLAELKKYATGKKDVHQKRSIQKWLQQHWHGEDTP